MLPRTFLGLLFALVVQGCASAPHVGDAPEAALPVPRFEEDSTDFPIQVPGAFEATTGYLIVYEDRTRPDGPTIRLPVAIVQRPDADPNASPVLYLGGGPGSSALTVAAYPSAYPWTAERPFVVMEQRGTRHAQPALECPEFPNGRRQSRLTPEAGLAPQVEAAEACRERLEASGVDLSAYASATIAADAEDLRRVLGVREWTLYGVSYGTRVALAILRDYPGTVRAALLDSVLPPQARYDDESSVHLEASLGLVFRDCEADEACRTAFPDLRARFSSALAAADADPVVVTLREESLSRSLRGADLAGLVDLSETSGIATAPRRLDAIARRDTAFLGPLAAGGLSGTSSFAWGMRLSVWCSEAIPFSERGRAERPGNVLGGMESAVVAPEVCAAWGVPARPRREVRPVKSAVPVLLVAGEYDPLTPPRWAHAAARTLALSRVVVVRAEGHTPLQNWGGDGCAMRLAAAFVADPRDALDADLPVCLVDRDAPTLLGRLPRLTSRQRPLAR